MMSSSLDFPTVGVHGLKLKCVIFFNVKIRSPIPLPYLPVTLGLAFEVGLIAIRGQGRKG